MNRLTLVFLSFLAGWSVALTAHARSAVPIYSFVASGTNGAYPEANLALGPDGNFYGTTESGGASTNGTIFKVTTNGTFATLVNFNGTNGANPLAPLTLGTNGNFYGTTEYGGNTIGNSSLNAGLGGGTVFQVTTNGTLTTLVNFAATNGASPHAGLIWGPDGNLYGTTASGGSYADGTLFRVTTGGTLTTLTNFSGANGSSPVAGLTLGPDGNFYGTTQSGGAITYGTVFELMTNGTLKTLVNFDGTNNGVSPKGGLTLGPDGNLYGTTSASYLLLYTVFPGFTITIPSGNGTIFRVTTNGVLTNLVDFDNYTAGINPAASLTLGQDGNFYGTTYSGGSSGVGTVFEVTTNGTLTTLVNFNNTNGAYPLAGLTFGPDNNLYGTASSGGAGVNGTVFEFGLPPYSIALAGSGGGNYTVLAGSYPDTTNRIWATTNLALPSSWQVLGAITTDANGMGQLLDTNTTNIPAKYYRLSYP
jgi:uncharacterized repeat protein (TIGR03803 family)